MSKRRMLARSPLLLLVACVSFAAPATVHAQQRPAVSVSFANAPMTDVLAFFAQFSRRSIVAGVGVGGLVSAVIDAQPWDQALAAILGAHGFVARELASGIIMVEDPRSVVDAPVPLVTRVFRLNYVPAAELQAAVASILSKRGSVAAVPSMNALVVTDEPRVMEAVAGLLTQP